MANATADSWDELRTIAGIDALAYPWAVGAAERLGLHASLRRFYRLTAATRPRVAGAAAAGPHDTAADSADPGAGGGPTLILVVYEQDDAAAVERYERAAHWFAAAGVRVPAVISASSRGLLVEDGGDALLCDQPAGPELVSLYREAARIILMTQGHGDGAEAPNPAWALDAERLRNELDFTEEHALRGWLGMAPAPSRERAFDRLAEAVAALPRVMCHRDYHSRNLLVTEAGLFVVDFQDVMEGPLFYDLASLLRDDYRDLPTECRAAALQTFWEGAVAGPAQATASIQINRYAAVPEEPGLLPPAARQAWALTCAQRALKALGTFGFQVNRAGRHEYAAYARRTWAHARRALRQLGQDDLIAELGAFERL